MIRMSVIVPFIAKAPIISKASEVFTMNGEVLIQNIFSIFVIAIILEAAIMAVFTLSAFKGLDRNRAIEATRDGIIILIAFFICYKIEVLRIFRGTGINMPWVLDVVISGLVLARMTNFVRQVMARFKSED
jgi:hypothetical protein